VGARVSGFGTSESQGWTEALGSGR
jgi:hypothetical protein